MQPVVISALAATLGLSGDLQSEVALGELCLDDLLQAERQEIGYRPLPRYPGIKVDVAVSVPEQTRAGELTALIQQAGRQQVKLVQRAFPLELELLPWVQQQVILEQHM